jgi:hypothetical protein
MVPTSGSYIVGSAFGDQPYRIVFVENRADFAVEHPVSPLDPCAVAFHSEILARVQRECLREGGGVHSASPWLD